MTAHSLLTAQQILAILAEQRQHFLRLGVRSIGLFGSYGRGNPKPGSDIDFLVVFENPSFDRYMDLKFFLEDLFDRPVDLVMEEALKPRLRPYILSEVQYAQGL
jgi:predicted nucleotidyltransferase